METLHCRCGSALVDRNLTLQVSALVDRNLTLQVSALADRNLTLQMLVSFGGQKSYTAGVGQLWWTETLHCRCQLWWTEILHCRCESALVDGNLTLQMSVSFGGQKPYTASVGQLWWMETLHCRCQSAWWMETLHCRCQSAVVDRNLKMQVLVSFGGQKPYTAGVCFGGQKIYTAGVSQLYLLMPIAPSGA